MGRGQTNPYLENTFGKDIKELDARKAHKYLAIKES
jgi:hypothetical protein